MSPTPPLHPSPVAIGGLGGSGTRVFSALLQAAGFYMGDCLNAPLDNLWFTALFKRKAWASPTAATRPAADDVENSISLFYRAMTTGLASDLSADEGELLDRLRDDLPPKGRWQCGASGPHVDSLRSSVAQSGYPGCRWGWKEPNTHIFLPHLDRHIPNFKFIHIVRNGLDMSFSANKWQMTHWSHLFDLTHAPDTPVTLRQLRFWTAANRATIAYGQHHMSDRFMVVSYDDFCARPRAHWARIREFIALPADQALPDGLVKPSTIGRSAEHDLSAFPAADLADAQAVQELVDQTGTPEL